MRPVRQHRPTDAVHAKEVRLELPPRLVDRGVLERARVAEAGVVHDGVDPAGVCQHMRDACRDRRIVVHIHCDQGGAIGRRSGRVATGAVYPMSSLSQRVRCPSSETR